MSDVLNDVVESFEDFQLADSEETQEETTQEQEGENTEQSEESQEKKESKEKSEVKAEEETEEKKPKKSNRLEKRFRHFKTEISSRDAEILELKNELKALKKEYGQLDDDGYPLPPIPKSFANEQAYKEAWHKWDKDVTKRKIESEVREKMAFQNKAITFKEAIKQEKLKWKDYDQVVTEDFLNLPARNYIQEAIMDPKILSNGPDVLYALAKTPDILIQLNSMSKAQAMATLGQISEQVKAFVKNKQKPKPTQTKKLVKTVNTSSVVPKPDILNDDSAFDKYMKDRGG